MFRAEADPAGRTTWLLRVMSLSGPGPHMQSHKPSPTVDQGTGSKTQRTTYPPDHPRRATTGRATAAVYTLEPACKSQLKNRPRHPSLPDPAPPPRSRSPESCHFEIRRERGWPVTSVRRVLHAKQNKPQRYHGSRNLFLSILTVVNKRVPGSRFLVFDRSTT